MWIFFFDKIGKKQGINSDYTDSDFSIKSENCGVFAEQSGNSDYDIFDNSLISKYSENPTNRREIKVGTFTYNIDNSEENIQTEYIFRNSNTSKKDNVNNLNDTDNEKTKDNTTDTNDIEEKENEISSSTYYSSSTWDDNGSYDKYWYVFNEYKQ